MSAVSIATGTYGSACVGVAIRAIVVARTGSPFSHCVTR